MSPHCTFPFSLSLVEPEQIIANPNLHIQVEQPFGPPNTPASGRLSPDIDPTDCVDEIDTFTPLNDPVGIEDLSDHRDELHESLSQLTIRPELPKTLSFLHATSHHFKAQQQALTMAISGPTSSGKTTLAILLSAIFGFYAPNNLPAKIHRKDDDDEQPKSPMLILHQDNYFQPKERCPFITFDSAISDVTFLDATLANDTIGEYIIQDLLPHPLTTTPTTSILSDGYEIPNPGNARIIASEHELIDTRTPVWRITGPDTDCVAAIDFQRLLAAVLHVKQTGTMPRRQFRFQIEDDDEEESLNVDVHSNPKDSRSEGLVIENRDLVREMWDMVETWIEAQAGANAEVGFEGLNVRGEGFMKGFCFVEGFLLFSDPVVDVEVQRKDTKPAQEEAKNTLMDVFDVRLFLPTAKEVAKRRRFQRAAYVDQPEGTRIPGQMWKTEGYFDKVVWENYRKEHAWILSDLDAEGIDIRPGTDFNVEGTVRWAVGVVLDELAKLEKAAREGMLQGTE